MWHYDAITRPQRERSEYSCKEASTQTLFDKENMDLIVQYLDANLNSFQTFVETNNSVNDAAAPVQKSSSNKKNVMSSGRRDLVEHFTYSMKDAGDGFVCNRTDMLTTTTTTTPETSSGRMPVYSNRSKPSTGGFLCNPERFQIPYMEELKDTLSKRPLIQPIDFKADQRFARSQSLEPSLNHYKHISKQ